MDNVANDCRNARVAFSLRLDGELGQGRTTRLAQHLRSCHSCRVFTRELEAISDRLRRCGWTAPMLQPVPDDAACGRASLLAESL